MVYGRARRSDLARATHIAFDLSPDGLDGFVECRVKTLQKKKPVHASDFSLWWPL